MLSFGQKNSLIDGKRHPNWVELREHIFMTKIKHLNWVKFRKYVSIDQKKMCKLGQNSCSTFSWEEIKCLNWVEFRWHIFIDGQKVSTLHWIKWSYYMTLSKIESNYSPTDINQKSTTKSSLFSITHFHQHEIDYFSTWDETTCNFWILLQTPSASNISDILNPMNNGLTTVEYYPI